MPSALTPSMQALLNRFPPPPAYLTLEQIHLTALDYFPVRRDLNKLVRRGLLYHRHNYYGRTSAPVTL